MNPELLCEWHLIVPHKVSKSFELSTYCFTVREMEMAVDVLSYEYRWLGVLISYIHYIKEQSPLFHTKLGPVMPQVGGLH